MRACLNELEFSLGGLMTCFAEENLQREKDWRSAGCGVAKGFSCNIGQGSLITSSIMVAFSLVYFILYCEFLRRSLQQLRRHSNVEFKFANTIVRIQVCIYPSWSSTSSPRSSQPLLKSVPLHLYVHSGVTECKHRLQATPSDGFPNLTSHSMICRI